MLADSLGTASTGTIPIGGIIIWSGSTGSVPDGWALCNGSNGTPNLQDRFVVGAGSGYAVDATGGSANAVLIAHSHVHNNDIVEEGNEFSIGPGNRSASSKNDSTGITGVDASGNASTTQTGTNKNLPPYYALAYIMRIA